jgi:hypothetical protein
MTVPYEEIMILYFSNAENFSQKRKRATGWNDEI